MVEFYDSYLLHSTGVRIGFVPNVVSVPESAGTVQLCAEVIEGNPAIERDIVISFSTADGPSDGEENAATGECSV